MTLTPDDLSSLSDLLSSRGWELFLAHTQKEWGPEGWAAKLEATFGNKDLEPSIAQQMYAQAKCAHREVWRVLNWPQEQVQAAKARPHLEPTMSRRGTL